MAISNVLASGASVATIVRQGVNPVSVTANTPIIFQEVVSDPYACWNLSTNAFTAPLTGVYSITLAMRLTAASGVINYVYKNGVLVASINYVIPSVALDFGGYQISLVQGDVIDIRPDTSFTEDGGPTLCHLEISKVG